MDPATIFGVVGGAIALVETSIAITQKIKEIHERGSLEAHDAQKAWAEQIQEDIQVLQNEMSKLGPTQETLKLRVEELARNCCSAGNDLQKLLDTLVLDGQQSRSSVISAMKRAAKSTLKKKQIDDLTAELKKCEADLHGGLLKELYIQNSAAHVVASKSFISMDSTL